MSSTLYMERTGAGPQHMGYPGMGTPQAASPTSYPVGTNWLMVPKCFFKVEKCTGGFKVWCHCDDKLACSMVQNLCSMMAGGFCSCCVQWNGMTVAQYNWTCGFCKWEMTDSGVCFTCTSGDQHCCEMLQSCCECLSCMFESGCTCTFFCNQTPVCCGGCEAGKTTKKK